jgi:hypothetical protein
MRIGTEYDGYELNRTHLLYMTEYSVIGMHRTHFNGARNETLWLKAAETTYSKRL